MTRSLRSALGSALGSGGRGPTEPPSGAGRRAGPPVRWALATFGGTIVALSLAAGIGAAGPVRFPATTSSQFGVVAVTTFAIAGGLAAYRAVALRSIWAASIAAVLLGPGATWSWSAFVADRPSMLGTSLVVPAAWGLTFLLVARGSRTVRWLEVFGGIGSLGLGVAAAVVRLDPSGATATVVPALLVAVSGMTCLYGLLVDLEVAEYRSLTELNESRRQVQEEVTRVEGLLHDLRSGLLAIEAAVGSVDDELAGPLQSEAARLRQLTVTGHRTPGPFDLSASVTTMVTARRRGGAEVSFPDPGPVVAWGEQSEILAIVDNLLANADRHGRRGRIDVRLDGGGSTAHLVVTNPGRLPTDDPELVFQPGLTTHPDGCGLGLARARMLAGINGGDLRVGPAEEGKTSFVLTLRTEPEAAVA